MKFSVYTLSLPAFTPEEGAQIIAENELRGVEWRVVDDPVEFSTETPTFTRNNRCSIAMTAAGGARARECAVAHGLEVIGIAPYIAVGDIPAFERATQTAVACGTRNIRVRAPSVDGRSFDELFRSGREFLEEAADIARHHDVKAVLEMHQRTLCPSASLAERIVRGLDPEHVGVIYDAGNLILEGYEDPRIGLDLLGEYLCHVHLKNAGWRRDDTGGWDWYWAPLDAGILNARAFLKLLEAHGYRGWVSLEDLSTERAAAETLRYNVRLLREWGFLT